MTALLSLEKAILRSTLYIDRAVPSSFPFSLVKSTYAETAFSECKIEAEGALLRAGLGFRVVGELTNKLGIDR